MTDWSQFKPDSGDSGVDWKQFKPAPPTSLGDVAAPDVFTEGSAQAAATSPGLGNEIKRGLLTGGRGLALANAGMYEMASPLLSDETKAKLQEPSFALAQRLRAEQEAIPPSDIGSQMVGGLVSGPVAMLGAAPSRGQDVIEQGGTPAQAQNVTNIALASELPALALPGLGTGVLPRVGLQALAGGALQAGGHLAENAVLPPNLQTPLTVPEVAQAAGGAGMFGLIPHGPEPMPQTPAEVAALRGEVQPPPVPLESQGPSPVPTGVTEATPLEQLNARPEVPPEVPVGNAGERAAAPVDGQGEVESAEGAKPPPNWTFDVTKEVDGLPAADAPVAHDVAQLAARAQDAGLKEQDIEPFHDETDAEYTDRIASELTAYEERQRGTEPPANEADNRQDFRGQTGSGEPGGEPQANAAPAENQATGNVPRSQAEPAAAAGGDTEVLDRETPQTTVKTSVGDRGVNTSYDVPLLGSSLKDGTVVLDKDWNPVIPDGQLKGLDRTPFIAEHEAVERQHEDAGMDYTQAHQLAETAEHAKLLDHLGLKADTPEADAAIKAYEDSYKPDLIAAAKKKNPQTAPNMLEKPYEHPENVEQRRMLSEVNANEGITGGTQAQVAKEDAALGKPERQSPHEPTTNEGALEEAKRRIAENPAYPRELATDLLATKRSSTPVEKATLAHERQRINTEMREAKAQIESGNEGEKAVGIARREAADLDYELNSAASLSGASESGAHLQAAQIGVNEDFSIGRLVKAAKEEKGVKFTEADRKKAEDTAIALEKSQERLAKAKEKDAGAKPPKKTMDEKRQSQLKADIEKYEGQIKQRLSACPI